MPRQLIPIAAYLAGFVTPHDLPGLGLVGLGLCMGFVLVAISRDRADTIEAQKVLNTDRQVDAAVRIAHKAGADNVSLTEVLTLVDAARKVSQ